MGVFDAKTKTKLAVPDPITDHTLPNSKSLSFKAITQPAALAGTKGQQCNLVHGDCRNARSDNRAGPDPRKRQRAF